MNYQKVQIIRDFEKELEVKPFNVDQYSPQEDIDNVLMLLSDTCQGFIDKARKILDIEESYSITEATNSKSTIK